MNNNDKLLEMLRLKQQEYIILTQSERIAKMIINYYGEELFFSKYHDRVNREYDELYTKAVRNNLLVDNPIAVNNIGIPINCVIARLEDSRDELLANNDQRYLSYSRLLMDVFDDIKYLFYYTTIVYRDGYLYFVEDKTKEETLVTKESFNNFFGRQKKKTL